MERVNALDNAALDADAKFLNIGALRFWIVSYACARDAIWGSREGICILRREERQLFERNGPAVDLDAEQGVGLFAKVDSFMEAGLPIQLIGREVKVTVRSHRHGVRP